MKNLFLASHTLTPMRKSIPLVTTVAFSLLYNSFLHASEAKAYGDIRFRYENVEQAGLADDADALTVRAQVGIKSAELNGFSAVVEMEANRQLFGVDNYRVPPSGYNPGAYPVIPDPEFTEIDQAFVQYKNDTLTAKIGAQVIALGNQRYIGHVGWRQDRVTHDAISANVKVSDDLTVYIAHATKRNRLFGEDQDQDAKDSYFNAVFNTSFGKLTAYAYLLEDDYDLSQGPAFLATGDRDSYGVILNGSFNLGSQKISYTAEYAEQDLETASGDEFSMPYVFLEAATKINGAAIKLGHEVLGSDDGTKGFGTPLGTVHKFNGWADAFILPELGPGSESTQGGDGTPLHGLTDTYLLVSGKAGPGKMTLVYHQYSDATSNGMGDYGSEFDAAYGIKLGKKYAGIKYANYDSDGYKTDTEKLWIWFGTKF